MEKSVPITSASGNLSAKSLRCGQPTLLQMDINVILGPYADACANIYNPLRICKRGQEQLVVERKNEEVVPI